MNNSILEPSREAVFAVFEQMEESHPDDSHWYLPVLAVDPAQQWKKATPTILTGICPCSL
jgi:hypothetical protein